MERYGMEEVDWFKTMFDQRARWVPAYFRDFPMGSLIRTTSVSESENSFYKTFTKPRSNLVEFIMSFDHALESQRNASSKLDYLDSIGIPIMATELSFEKQASIMYTNHIFRRVQKEIVDACFHCPIDAIVKDKFFETFTLKDLYGKMWTMTDVKLIPEVHFNGRWLKSSLAKVVHGQVDIDFDLMVAANPKQLAVNKMYEVLLGFGRKFEAKIETVFAFTEGVEELGKSIESDFPVLSLVEKKSMIEEFYGHPRPIEIDVHPPKVVRTKGSCSQKKSKKEAAILNASKPKRRCGKSNEIGYHDSRNCGRQSEGKGKEKV
ncbi:uncharacterized protein LOC125186403 [Salvia hispanica]|uniref:uncharacterized protein LOC125186403 n=1 Tax=Salvia hispanica TaxID=49212 RepID=UPI0020091D30|nr:uncharacterized protein LOC125186403 [Salvia hispanica]